MAYKEDIVVISVPVKSDVNQMLREIALFQKRKSKTQAASHILTAAIKEKYNSLREEKQWGGNTNT